LHSLFEFGFALPKESNTEFLLQQGLDVRSVNQLATNQGPASIKDVVAHGIKRKSSAGFDDELHLASGAKK